MADVVTAEDLERVIRWLRYADNTLRQGCTLVYPPWIVTLVDEVGVNVKHDQYDPESARKVYVKLRGGTEVTL